MATVFGTNKLAVLAGNLSSILSYTKRIKILWKLMLPTMTSALIFAYLGALSVSMIPKRAMEYVVFFILIVMAGHTFTRKDFGLTYANK
ncbi:sulfite exporter TauE/SafE family protein, partial [Pseudomonas viridiflava]|uniref:sulfite exporter TauE/SafE family protein n=1 Tax=Pseudomonas viridiflava TaxID=33069 RepID=UPI0023F755F6